MSNSRLEEVYEGQFGSFTITDHDRQGVVVYRAGLAIAAFSFAIGCGLFLWQGNLPWVMASLNWLYLSFCLGLGVSLLTIHIYLIPLHRLLQVFWGIGVLASVGLMLRHANPLAQVVYEQPLTLFGVGFVFAALTGIYFKEAFCFQRLETLFLTFLVPILCLGHLIHGLPVAIERNLLALWAALFVVFAVRKWFQRLPADIGDKSVFAYLKSRSQAPT
jgi:uncharacterized integral membrane protein